MRLDGKVKQKELVRIWFLRKEFLRKKWEGVCQLPSIASIFHEQIRGLNRWRISRAIALFYPPMAVSLMMQKEKSVKENQMQMLMFLKLTETK